MWNINGFPFESNDAWFVVASPHRLTQTRMVFPMENTMVLSVHQSYPQVVQHTSSYRKWIPGFFHMVYGCGLPMILIVVFHDVPIAMVNDQRLIRMNNWMNQFRISPTNAIFRFLKGTIAGSNGSVMRNGDVQKSDFQRRPAFGSNVQRCVSRKASCNLRPTTKRNWIQPMVVSGKQPHNELERSTMLSMGKSTINHHFQ